MKLKSLPPKWYLPGRLLAVFGVLTLLVTSVYWAMLSARLQNGNADNLIDSYLFSSAHVFHAASFPGAHSFLLKWPLFVISSVFGNNLFAITFLTVVCALAPVVALVVLLAKVERRPAVFGVWCLALASMLLLVPAQPSPGALLPVNFAMLATRNVEYVAYVAVLVLLVISRRWRDKRLIGALVIGVLLIASDKLFVPLLVAALVGMAILNLARHPQRLVLRAWPRSRPTRWLAAVLVIVVGGYALLWAIARTHITGIANESSTSPYALVTAPHTLVMSAGYALLSLFTLFGANPAHGQLELTAWPHAVLQTLRTSPLAYTYVANALLLGIVLVAAGWFVANQLTKRYKRDNLSTVTTMLLFSAGAALLIYMFTNHYYPADSRYLTISFFALLLAAAQTLTRLRFSRRVVGAAALLLLVLLPFSVVASHAQYAQAQQAAQNRDAFNKDVAQALTDYHVDTVVGDYWDVVPIRSQTHYKLNIVPLSSCLTPLQALSSTAWQRAARGASVGYVINSAPAPTGFKACDPRAITAALGHPTRRIPIHTPGHNGSWLYVYDNGVKQIVTMPPVRVQKAKALTPPTGCQNGSVLSIVAHEDDDILFMNPDLQNAINQHLCITSLYLTTGDAGGSEQYARARLSGSQAAYAAMYHVANHWRLEPQMVGDKTIATYTLLGVPQVRLLFYGLPDGNVDGRGFAAPHYESLAQLRSGTISTIRTVDGRSTYNPRELTASLSDVMNVIQPNEVRTQDYTTNLNDGDHSDHHAAGYFAKRAFAQYNGTGRLTSYIGYPGRLLPANVIGQQLDIKRTIFFTYGLHDAAVCSSADSCRDTAYEVYLQRQYSKSVGISIAPPDQRVLTNNSGGVCAISHAPHSLYCTLPHKSGANMPTSLYLP